MRVVRDSDALRLSLRHSDKHTQLLRVMLVSHSSRRLRVSRREAVAQQQRTDPERGMTNLGPAAKRMLRTTAMLSSCCSFVDNIQHYNKDV